MRLGRATPRSTVARELRRDHDDRRAPARHRTQLPVEAVLGLVDAAVRVARPARGRSASRRCSPPRAASCRALVTVRAHDKVRQAVDLLQEHGISQAPVVREDSDRGQRVRRVDPRTRAARPDLPRPRCAAGRRGRGDGAADPHGRVRRAGRVRVRGARARAGGARDEGGPGRWASSPAATCWTSSRTGGGRRAERRARARGRRRWRPQGLDLVVMHDRPHRRPDRGARPDLDDVRSVLREVRPQVVAIDSPPAWSAGARSRRTERQLAELGIQRVPDPVGGAAARQPFFDWMKAGMAVFALADELGYPLDTDRAPRPGARSRSSRTAARRCCRLPDAARHAHARLAGAGAARARRARRTACARSTRSTPPSPR